VEGLIIKGGERFFVEPAGRYTRDAGPADLLFYRESDVIADPVWCPVDTLSSKVNAEVARTQSVGINESQPAAPVSPMRQADLATEADLEYVQAFGGSGAANNDILSIVNQVNGVYQPEIGLTFNVVFQRAWATDDPFNGATLSDMLNQLRNTWINSPPIDIASRDLVHLWTGRDVDGNQTGLAFDTVTINGVAQRGVVCVVIPANPTNGTPAQTFSYGVSERQINPLTRVIVPAHEMGHNFSASHPEQVGHGECGNTIMSGVTVNTTQATFCQFSRDEITNYINYTLGSPNKFTPSCLDVATNVTPSVQFSTTDYRVTEGTPSVTITATRSSGEGTSTVQYQTLDGSASERSDYTTATGTLTFNPGETSKTFTVLITNDSYGEGLETFQVQLNNPSGATLGTPSTANVTIDSNETANGPNPVRAQSFNADFFVRQHYADFLNREPDASGLSFWIGQTSNCGSTDPLVCRVNVSAAFFLSIEFQETGFYAIRVQRVAFGRRSSDQTRMTYRELVGAQRQIGAGVV
ncbi:MAG TPA: Calx-beta domain-containing protein, partial [Pyrinomonadaceae bacterium]|nr:Calx-beta domain-containing protein [Pyrinomonadaceae bacterium]